MLFWKLYLAMTCWVYPPPIWMESIEKIRTKILFFYFCILNVVWLSKGLFQAHRFEFWFKLDQIRYLVGRGHLISDKGFILQSFHRTVKPFSIENQPDKSLGPSKLDQRITLRVERKLIGIFRSSVLNPTEVVPFGLFWRYV